MNSTGLALTQKQIPEKQINKIKSGIDAIRNKLTIKEANFKKKYGYDAAKEDEEDLFVILDRQALQLERGLEVGYRIDIKKTSIIRWMNLLKMAEEKSAELSKMKHQNG